MIKVHRSASAAVYARDSMRHMSRSILRIVALLTGLLLALPATAQGNAIRGRVQVVGNTVVSDQGTLLRGGPIVVSKTYQDQLLWAENPANMRRIRDAGLNTVRVICFDAYQASHGQDSYTVDEVLSHLDTIVDNAAQQGLYVVINFHDVGHYVLDGNRFPLREFWQKVAPRYASRTHVLYEIANEPVMWSANEYTSAVLNDLKQVYQIIRAAAPDTHIIHLTVSHINNPIKPLADQYAALLGTFDPTKDSIGIHGYNSNSSANVVSLKASYPTFVTEWDYPGNPGPIQPLDGEAFNGQTFERLQISSLDWSAGRIDSGILSFQDFVDRYQQDARAKGYIWPRDNFTFQTDVAPSAKQVTASQAIAGYEAYKGVDSYFTPDRTWASNAAGDKWLRLDFGTPYTIDRWVVRNAGAAGQNSIYNTRDYRLQSSMDGTSWTDVDAVSGNTADLTNRTITSVSTRFMRLLITNPTSGGDSISRIAELELYCSSNCGSAPSGGTSNVALGKVVSASSSYGGANAPVAAVDGATSTGWSPSGSDSYPFIEVDLGQPYTISSVDLVTRQDYDQDVTRRNFQIWASNNPDMSQGHVVLGGVGSTSLSYQATYTAIVSDQTKYRYIAAIKTAPEYFFIAELRVNGK